MPAVILLKFPSHTVHADLKVKLLSTLNVLIFPNENSTFLDIEIFLMTVSVSVMLVNGGCVGVV